MFSLFYGPPWVDLGRLKNEHTHTRAVRVSYLLCKIPEKKKRNLYKEKNQIAEIKELFP